jgi:hypothetical protein
LTANARAQRQVASDAEVANGAERHFPDAEGGAVFGARDQLAVVGQLGAIEQGPRPMLERRLGGISVGAAVLDDLAAPGERRRALPAGRQLTRVKRAGRQSLLVDARLELLGFGEMAPARLQRERVARIP